MITHNLLRAADTPRLPSAGPVQGRDALVNEWIKHAETKAAGTLAAAGVSAGVLYNLVRNVSDTGRLLDILAILCALCIAGGGLCAAWALRPCLWSKEEPTSGLLLPPHRAEAPPRD